MRIKDKTMIHIHRNGIHDDVWHEGNEFLVDNNYNSSFTSNFDISTGIRFNDNCVIPLDHLMLEMCNKFNTTDSMLEFKNLPDEDFIKNCFFLREILEKSSEKIIQIGLKNREEALEKVRRINYPTKPSRYHSLWVCDEYSKDFWSNMIDDDCSIYNVLLNGHIFKSSDSFLPNYYDTKEKQIIDSDKYWNPVFKTDQELKEAEYLFQGRAKVLKRVK